LRYGEAVANAWRYVEFFTANVRNPNTRRAYARACPRFFAWCEDRGLTLTTIRPHDVATYIEVRGQSHSAPDVKQQLAHDVRLAHHRSDRADPIQRPRCADPLLGGKVRQHPIVIADGGDELGQPTDRPVELVIGPRLGRLPAAESGVAFAVLLLQCRPLASV
jgi:hypothetical protein